jgi:hypothetical protein
MPATFRALTSDEHPREFFTSVDRAGPLEKSRSSLP